MKKLRQTCYEISIYFVIFCLTLLITSFSLYYFNISISFYHPIISILISSLIFYLLRNKLKINKPIKIISYALILVAMFTFIQTFVYDRSSDGNTYHKDAVSNLKNGWNPVYQSSSDFSKEYYHDTGYDMEIFSIWKDHYAKANWVMEANIYALTNNIESAKVINLIFMFVLFGISWSYFSKKIKEKKALLLSILLTFNPICCSQLFTFYNDQLGTTILFSIILLLLSLDERKDLFEKFLLISCLFIIELNIKFNMLGYVLIFTFIYMIKYLIVSYNEKKKEFFNIFKKLSLLFVVLFVLAFGLIGYSTYLKNTIDHGNPFFPVYGENKEDIITAQEPKEFLEYNNFQKVYYSLFSKTNNLLENKTANLKVPFTFDFNEVKESASVDTRIGGFGIFFSGILIIAFVIIISNFKNLNKNEKTNIIILISTILGLTFGISEGWWARYNPSIYIIAIIALYLLLKYKNNKIFTIIYFILIILNVSIILGLNTGYTLKESFKINKDLYKLKNKEINYKLNYGTPIGVLSNLDDFNIKYYYQENNTYNALYYNFIMYEERK